MMTPQEIAQETLDLLEKDGWCKESLIWTAASHLRHSGDRYREGSRCLIGAAVGYMLTMERQEGDALYDYCTTRASKKELREFAVAARKVIDEQFPGRAGTGDYSWFTGPDLVFFNNHPDTTFEDIRMVLEKVIADECI